MFLTDYEKSLLQGAEGEAKQHAMQFLVDYGEALGADKFVEISDASIGVMGKCPTKLLADREFDSMEAVFSWSNMASEKVFEEIPPSPVRRRMILSCIGDEDYYDTLGLRAEKPEYYESLKAAHDFYKKIGLNDCMTCAPQILGHMPARGEHTITGESSQVIFQNSVIGARCNCESLITTGCAMMVGRTPNIGLHRDENRWGTHLIKVDKIPKDLYEWDLLGYWIGKRIHTGVPVLEMDVPFVSMEEHKSLGASMCTSGLVDMYHIIGHTPEAGTYELAFGGNTPKEVIHYTAEDEAEIHRKLDWATEKEVDTVLMGCPQYTIYQLGDLAKLLDGKKCKARLYIMSPKMLIDQARVNGWAQKIEESGAMLISSVCMPMIQVWPDNLKVLATDSGKMAHYLPSTRPDVQIHMGSMEHCIEAAVTGVW